MILSYWVFQFFRRTTRNGNSVSRERAYCRIHVSIKILLKVLSADVNQPSFTHRLLIRSLVEGEYRNIILNVGENFRGVHNGNSWVWPDEAVGRQFYTACARDGCQGDELYDFLDYYQRPLNGLFYLSYFSFKYVEANSRVNGNSGFWANQDQALSSSVAVILDPPSTWFGGVTVGMNPYGYGTDLRVCANIATAIANRASCNSDQFAIIAQDYTSSRASGTRRILDVFFGTEFDGDGDTCRFIEGNATEQTCNP